MTYPKRSYSDEMKGEIGKKDILDKNSIFQKDLIRIIVGYKEFDAENLYEHFHVYIESHATKSIKDPGKFDIKQIDTETTKV